MNLKSLLFSLVGLGAIATATLALKPDLANRLGLGLTDIQAVAANPANYHTKTVTLRGKVVNQIGVLGSGAYELQDGTSSLWVLTQAGLPAVDTQLFVQGTPQEGVSVAGKTFGTTLVEVKRWQ